MATLSPQTLAAALAAVFGDHPDVRDCAAPARSHTRILAADLGLPDDLHFCLYFHTFMHTSERARALLRKWSKAARKSVSNRSAAFDFASSGVYELILAARHRRLAAKGNAQSRAQSDSRRSVPVFAVKHLTQGARRCQPDLAPFKPQDFGQILQCMCVLVLVPC